MRYESEWNGKYWTLVTKGFYGDVFVGDKEDLVYFVNNFKDKALYGVVYARLALTTEDFVTTGWEDEETDFIQSFIEYEVNKEIGDTYSSKEKFCLRYPDHWVYEKWEEIRERKLPEEEEEEELKTAETMIVKDIFLAILRGIEKYVKDDNSVKDYYYSKEYKNR